MSETNRRKTKYLAHIRENERQTIEEHLEGTAKHAEQFAAAFGGESYARTAGWYHDIGKCSDAFLTRLLEQGPKVDHASAGAYELQRQGQMIEAMCVAGHHSGLLDMGNVNVPKTGTFAGRIQKVQNKQVPTYQIPEMIKQQPIVCPYPVDILTSPFSISFFTRFLFSCLVDADFLDTEQFMTGVARTPTTGLSELLDRFHAYIDQQFSNPKTVLNQMRTNLLRQCIQASEKPSGLYSLTIPTGGGKTIASLGFALEHAKKWGKTHIIYVIPYTSIIEQNAEVFRSILGRENVLEVHSNVEYDENTENTLLWKQSENWDVPVVVTTAVQFFESLFSNKSSICRKLHNFANAVLIFDEAQLLPEDHLTPCVNAIAELVQHFHSTALLCTATCPDFSYFFQGYTDLTIESLITMDAADWNVFQRNQILWDETMTEQALQYQLQKTSQVLCIVNKKSTAVTLYEEVKAHPNTYCLTRFLTAEDRSEQLRRIRQHLKQKESVCVIATSLVEAGVDVDFPEVYRELTGLDSILQAAGRCNRNQRKSIDTSYVHVFSFETNLPDNPTQACLTVHRKHIELDTKEAISDYFNHFYRSLLATQTQESSQTDKYHIMKETNQFNFATIGRTFHMIGNRLYTVYIPTPENEEAIQAVSQHRATIVDYRRLQRSSVSVYETHMQMLYPYLELIPNTNTAILRNKNLYDKHKGLLTKDPYQTMFLEF